MVLKRTHTIMLLSGYLNMTYNIYHYTQDQSTSHPSSNKFLFCNTTSTSSQAAEIDCCLPSTLRPYCWRHYILRTKNMEKYSWYSDGSFTPYWLVCTVLQGAINTSIGKNNHQSHSPMKPVNHNNPPARYMGKHMDIREINNMFDWV